MSHIKRLKRQIGVVPVAGRRPVGRAIRRPELQIRSEKVRLVMEVEGEMVRLPDNGGVRIILATGVTRTSGCVSMGGITKCMPARCMVVTAQNERINVPKNPRIASKGEIELDAPEPRTQVTRPRRGG